MVDLWEQLRDKLDTIGVGYPQEEFDRDDLKYLQKIFDESYVPVFLAMENKFQLPEEVARRMDKSLDEVLPILEAMANKGLVLTTTNIDPVFYAPLPYLFGWGDWSVAWIDRETAELESVIKPNLGASTFMRRDIFRTVPVMEALPDKTAVLPHDNLRQVFERVGTIAVTDCYCDKHHILLGETMVEPLERCFQFGLYADFLIEKGFARRVTADEAMAIQEKAKEAGFVPNFADLEKPTFLCNCSNHCGGNLTRSMDVNTLAEVERTNNYFAQVDKDLCVGCEVCVDKCWFKALSMGSEGTVEINLKKCNGCGVCVTKCPSGALSLREVDPSERYVPKPTHYNIRTNEEYMADLEEYKDIVKAQ